MVTALFEDHWLLAVNKPQGLVTERDDRLQDTLEMHALQYLQSKTNYPQKCFIGLPHRLDRPVSGVVLFAKKKSVLKQLNQMFEAREIAKDYLALVERQPPKKKDELHHWLTKDQKNRRATVSEHQTPGAVQGILHYQVLAEHNGLYLLHLKPLTGKFHQIRAQLSFIGCPIAGDSLYGATALYPAENAIALHAFQLQLTHPVTQEQLKIQAPVPVHTIWQPFKDALP